MRGLPGEMIRFCTLLTLALLAAPVRADASELPAGGSLAGVRGLLRVAAAANQPAGTISLGTEAGFYWMPEMLAGGQDHSRLVNSLTVAFTPWRYIEAALSARVVSDSSSGGAAGDELQVAVGDPRLVVKGGGEVGAGVSVGAAVDLRFLAGAGYFESAASATSALFSLLAGWQGDPGIPLGIHLNVGFRYDGSSSLVSDPSQLSEAQRLAIGLSSFHQVVSRLGVEVTTRYVGPFLEISLENLVGSGAPGFSDHPGYVSGGLRVWPTASKSLQLLAAVDVGFAGVADGAALEVSPGLYAPVIPRWNLMLGLSYRIDAFSDPAPAARRGRVQITVGGTPSEMPEGQSSAFAGVVTDAVTAEPVPNARVLVEGESVSPMAVDSATGRFRTYRLTPGVRAILIEADGYKPRRVERSISGGDVAQLKVALEPVQAGQPGTLRGTVKNTRGKVLRRSSVLIPSLDLAIKPDRDGTFSARLAPGIYTVLISAPGYRAQRKKLKISAGGTVILNVEMHR